MSYTTRYWFQIGGVIVAFGGSFPWVHIYTD